MAREGVLGCTAQEGGFSEEATFKAAPEVGPGSNVSLLALADLGQAEVDGSNEASPMFPSLATTRLMAAEAHRHHLLLHNGDISYAMYGACLCPSKPASLLVAVSVGNGGHRGFATQWEVFFEQMAPLVRHMPYVIQIGNHERDWPGSGDRYHNITDSGVRGVQAVCSAASFREGKADNGVSEECGV